MTRLDGFEKLTAGPGVVITFDRVNGSFTLAFASGRFAKDGKGHGCLIRHTWCGSLYSFPDGVEVLLEFDEETVDDFIRENIVVFDERVDILRYLSYQPASTPPKIEDAKREAVSGGGCFFEHNGYKYGLGKNDLTSWGAMGKYHTNYQNSRRKIRYNIWAIRRQIGVVQKNIHKR